MCYIGRSAMKHATPFTDVPAGLAPALEAKGFSELTVVQKAVLAPELAGRDLCISSQTGSGKTVALGFMVAGDLDLTAKPGKSKNARPQVLVIAPTRELAHQIGKELTWLFAGVGARLAVITGGTQYGRDFDSLKRAPHILIGTPGRLLDHIRRNSVDLSALKSLVMDEADQMLDMGFRDELEAILDRTPAERRTHLVSATLPREVLGLARRYQTDAVQVQGTRRGAANDDIEHVGYVVRVQDKVSALINLLLASPGERALVFVRTRVGTSQLALELSANGFSAAGLSGDMGQQERTATLTAFRTNAVSVLVATDVAARGLDITDVSRVIHFDLPENGEAFTHRSGRTGRAGNKGTSIMLVPPSARRRVQHLLQRTKVSLSYKSVPTAEQIRRGGDARLLAAITAQIAGDELSQRDLARQLLSQGDAVDVIAALLDRTSHVGACQPRELTPVKATKHDAKKPAARGSNARGRAFEGTRGSRDSRDEGKYVSFTISFGEKHGANASRLLAMVCRRGNVPGRSVGAIRIGEFRSVFDVEVAVAEKFAKASGRIDKREPNVKIRRWNDGPPPKHHKNHKQQGFKGRDKPRAKQARRKPGTATMRR